MQLLSRDGARRCYRKSSRKREQHDRLKFPLKRQEIALKWLAGSRDALGVWLCCKPRGVAQSVSRLVQMKSFPYGRFRPFPLTCGVFLTESFEKRRGQSRLKQKGLVRRARIEAIIPADESCSPLSKRPFLRFTERSTRLYTRSHADAGGSHTSLSSAAASEGIFLRRGKLSDSTNLT